MGGLFFGTGSRPSSFSFIFASPLQLHTKGFCVLGDLLRTMRLWRRGIETGDLGEWSEKPWSFEEGKVIADCW
jgi:hypothetical protein